MEDYITTLRRRIAFIMNVSAEIHLKASSGGQRRRSKTEKTGDCKDVPYLFVKSSVALNFT